MRRAKIVATLGPSSNTIEKITELIIAGMNVCRINMSHGTHESHGELISNIRVASKKANKEVAILADLQGPKIRVDKLAENLNLENDEIWVIGPTDAMDKYPEYKGKYIPTIYKDLVSDCFDGARILFDDGLMLAEAIERDRDVYKIKINVGGVLKSNKGINLPDCDVSAPSFTEKDRADLLFALSQNVDYLALSFVRKKEDIQEVKVLLHDLKVNIPIISKIEKPQAVDNIEGILEVTDVIMVARGDMGVEVGNHLVPSIQKKLIRMCNERGIPVITATQMLESMTHNPSPTRAEASDVANAIWDGTDAVMLSGETASGKYPVETVKTMVQIIETAEETPKVRPFLRNVDLSSVHASVMVAASLIGEKIFAKRILAVTESGVSCLKLAKFRPDTPCLGVTTTEETARKMCLYWGIEPFLLNEYKEDSFNFQEHVINAVKKSLGLVNGDKLVITRGDGKFFTAGSSNSVKVEIIKDTPKVLGGSEALEEVSDGKKKSC
ncbi:pyruvate kinase [Halobacteriovorax marinus]|uniref:Pyruvate kinase n=1 Tax=Halobacteriovorax marinus TaxID=97084 RepID=A0A1Y5FC99_9BACT|nr:pyruvate kinase [Halobacteriovorax marinus]